MKAALIALFSVLSFCSCAQDSVMVVGQMSGTGWQQYGPVTFRAAFLEHGEKVYPVSPYGSFTTVIFTKGKCICTLAFGHFSFDFVVSPSEPKLRLMIEALPDGHANITVEDSKENNAYRYILELLSGQYRMYSYFAGCERDSCLRMMRIEQAAYRHHRDSIAALYPGTYATEVLGRFYDLDAGGDSAQLPSTIKAQLLDRTPWGLADACNGKTIRRLAGLYLDYAPDTGIFFRRSVAGLLGKTPGSSPARRYLANAVFDIIATDPREFRLREFLVMAKDSPALLSDPVLSERCRRYGRVLPGSPLTDISLSDPGGQERSLSKVAAQNKYTLLLFWSSGCEHCMEELPRLQAFYQKYHPLGLEIYAVAIDSERDKWKQIIADKHLSWVNVFQTPDKLQMSEPYMITYTPTMVLCDRDGRILSRFGDLGWIERVMNAKGK